MVYTVAEFSDDGNVVGASLNSVLCYCSLVINGVLSLAK